MELTNIKDQSCPHCGAEITAEKRYAKHTNGHWNETRTFNCGYELWFSPNYMRVQENASCKNDEHYKRQQSRRKEGKEKLERYIRNMNVDSSFKDSLLYAIQHIV